MSNSINYYQVIPNSHFWTSLEQLLNDIKHNPNALNIEYLEIGLKNTYEQGYNILLREEYNEKADDEDKDYYTTLKDFQADKEKINEYINFIEEGLKRKFSESESLLYNMGFKHGYTEGANAALKKIRESNGK